MNKETIKLEIVDKVKKLVTSGNENPYEKVLRSSNASVSDWIHNYDFSVTEEEERMAEFCYSYPADRMKQMGEHIVEALLHGFISQSREINGRKRVRLNYQVGMEALAKYVVEGLENRGFIPIIMEPGSKNKVMEPLKVEDISDEQLLEWHKEAYQLYETELRDTCGMIRVGTFGQKNENGPQLTKEQLKTLQRIRICDWKVESEYIKPSELSFCSVVFPEQSVGECFDKLFEEFMEMNIEESEPFERIQQVLIDAMDLCECIHIKGYKGNETDLYVKMPKISNPEKETNFLNCGGDLNIPYGEVFTTPALEGTTGLFNVKDVFLQGKYYHNLKLRFEDGMVVDYSSEVDGVETKSFVDEGLLQPYSTISMGEFAIGTNTRAFSICHRYNLDAIVPILIYEKTGPHIAIGDPCFKGAEEAPVYNLYDKKEMIARANTRTSDKTNDDRYYQRHIDITIPYNQTEELSGLTAEGEKIVIIKNGKFVLPGAEKLNAGMEEL